MDTWLPQMMSAKGAKATTSCTIFGAAPKCERFGAMLSKFWLGQVLSARGLLLDKCTLPFSAKPQDIIYTRVAWKLYYMNILETDAGIHEQHQVWEIINTLWLAHLEGQMHKRSWRTLAEHLEPDCLLAQGMVGPNPCKDAGSDSFAILTSRTFSFNCPLVAFLGILHHPSGFSPDSTLRGLYILFGFDNAAVPLVWPLQSFIVFS